MSSGGPVDFNGKAIWITGASSGIGEALAYAFAATGAQVILSSRNAGRLQEAASRCMNPDRHMVLPLDLSDTSNLAGKVDAVLDRFGRIDILVNNGGISQRSFAADTSLETVRRIMETNFFGTVALTGAVLPVMLGKGSGRIVVISSLVGKIGTPLRSSYAASKHALHGYFDSLRAEIQRKGIGVTIVCPGFIRTSISVNALTADGSCHGVMDDAQACGMSADLCASRLLKAIASGRDEVFIGGRELLAVYLKRFFPGLYNRLILRAKVT